MEAKKLYSNIGEDWGFTSMVDIATLDKASEKYCEGFYDKEGALKIRIRIRPRAKYLHLTFDSKKGNGNGGAKKPGRNVLPKQLAADALPHRQI